MAYHFPFVRQEIIRYLTLPVSFMHFCLGCLTGETLELSLLLPLLTTQYPVFWGPSECVFFYIALGPTDLRFPWIGVHWQSFLGIRLLSMRWRCPNHRSLRFVMMFENTGCLVEERTYLFVICYDHTIRRIFLWHLISKTSSLASSLLVRPQHSAAYKSVERTHELQKLHLDVWVEMLVFLSLLQLSECPCCFANSVV